MIPSSIQEHINHWLQTEKDDNQGVISSKTLSGGCINECLAIKTQNTTYFIKYNFTEKFQGMFDAEAKGLDLLRSAGYFRIPKVIFHGEAGKYSFLLLEYIEEGHTTKDFWNHFGGNLAKLHTISRDYFGLDHNNYIGSLPQRNRPHETWSEFLANERLLPLIKQSFDIGVLTTADIKNFDRFIAKIANLLPVENSALLHGDLWSGNYLVASAGEPCLIDPAVYYGHREMDIAMTKLFGGFQQEFYNSYNEIFPLERGWEGRLGINQLYPLLVYLVLFGASYAGQIRQILKPVI